MNNQENEQEDEWIDLQGAMRITGMKRGTYLYYVETGKIRVRQGRGQRDHTYHLADTNQVKAERKQRRRKHEYFFDWIKPSDLPAVLALDFEVYSEALIGDIKLYSTWVKRNKHIGMCTFERKDRKTCIAYIGLLPVAEQVALDVLQGKRDELSITAAEIQDDDQNGDIVLLANSAVVSPGHQILLYETLTHIMAHWIEQYPHKRITRIYAQAASPAGDVLIQKFYFAPLYQVRDDRAEVVKDAYVLDLSRPGATRVIRNFQERLEQKCLALGLEPQERAYLPPLPADPQEPTQVQEPLHRFIVDREIADAAKPAPSTRQPREKPAPAESELPDGLISLKEYAAQHNLALSTLKHAEAVGYISPFTRGRWKQGRIIIQIALDAACRAAIEARYGKPEK